MEDDQKTLVGDLTEYQISRMFGNVLKEAFDGTENLIEKFFKNIKPEQLEHKSFQIGLRIVAESLDENYEEFKQKVENYVRNK